MSEELAFKHILATLGGQGIASLGKAPPFAQSAIKAHASFASASTGARPLVPFLSIGDVQSTMAGVVTGTFGNRYVLLDPQHLSSASQKMAWGLHANWDFRVNRNRAYVRLIAIFAASAGKHQSLTFRYEPPGSRAADNHKYWHTQLACTVGGGARIIDVPLAIPLPKGMQSFPALPLNASSALESLLCLLLSVYGTSAPFWSKGLTLLVSWQQEYRTAVEFLRRSSPDLATTLGI